MITLPVRWFWCRTLVLTAVVATSLPPVFALDYSGGTYSQSFDTLAGTTNNTSGVAWTNDSTLPGWYASRTNYSVTDATLGGSAAAFTVTDVAANVGLLSFGAAGSTDRALGARSTGGVPDANPVLFGVSLANTSSDTLTEFTVTYTGEQWLQADTYSAHVLHLEYKFGATAIADATGWLAASGGLFTGPRYGATPTAFDGNAVANRTLRTVTVTGISWAPDTTLWLRFRDTNESGNEHGLAVDDFSFTAALTVPNIVTGPWSGNVSPTSATVSTSIDRAGGSVRAVASLAADFTGPLITSNTVNTQSTDGFAARLNFTGLALTWPDLSTVETGYRIERAPAASGTWVALDTTAANATLYTDAAADPGVTYHYRLVALNSTTEAAPTDSVSAVAPEPLVRWKLLNFEDAAMADISDDDGDGFPLLIEYALGANPLLPDSPPNYAASVVGEGAARRLVLDLRRDPARNDVTLLVQASSDLGSWQEIARSEVGTPFTGVATISGEVAGPAPRVIRIEDVEDVENPSVTPRRFLRVKAQH